ncbi:MAG TPA: transcriptional regulator [Stellaceae bacterium]|nr:transcriptional regulator [Stellaceae bacterium]
MNDFGSMLLEGLSEAVEHAKGRRTNARERVVMVRVPAQIDVAAIRQRLGMNRPAFAARFGFNVKTLTKWETGERAPEGPTRAYLTVIDRNPEAVEQALSGADVETAA